MSSVKFSVGTGRGSWSTQAWRRVLGLILVVALAGWACPIEAGAAQGADVVVSEILASNVSTSDDGDNDSSDWIELWNRGSSSVNLAGWELIDSSKAWTFPSVTLVAGEFLIVWASGKDRQVGELHTNFKLSASGESLVLADATGAIVAGFESGFPAQRPDVSYGLGSNAVVGFMTPTPDAANTAASAGIVAAPTAAVGRGVYGSTVTEVLASVTAGATIRYTLDGSVPTESATQFSGSITIQPPASGLVTVRAKAFASGMEPSDESTWSYVFPAGLFPENSAAAAGLSEYPIVMLYTDDGGEPPIEPRAGARVEMIDSDPDLGGFAISVGVERAGDTGVTRLAKKSYRVAFGAQWGGPSELEYPLFDEHSVGDQAPVSKFKRLDLHGGSFAADPVQQWPDYMINDRVVRETHIESGMLGTQGRYATFFFNGEYWGMYQIRERFDHHFRASRSEFPATEFEATKVLKQVGGVWSVTNGTGALTNAVFGSSSYGAVDHIVGDPDSMLRVGAMELALPAHQCEFLATSSMNNGDLDPTIWLMNDADGLFNARLSPYAAANLGCLAAMMNRWIDASAAIEAQFSEIVKELYCPGGPLTPEALLARMERLRDDAAGLFAGDYAKWNLNWLANIDRLIGTLEDETTSAFVTLLINAGHIDGCDRAPELTVASNLATTTAQMMDLGIAALDPEAAQVTFGASGLPPGLAIAASTGRITGQATTPGDYTMTVSATDPAGNTSSAVVEWQVIEASTSAPVVLNEYNASTSSGWAGTDPAFGAGAIQGNGGDWFELLVTDQADLRGYTIELWDRDNQYEHLDQRRAITFTQAPILADLAPGTMITVAESGSEDLSYDPAAGDWTLALTSNSLGQGSVIVEATQSNFDTNRHEMRVLLRASDGGAVGAFVGETDTWRSVADDNVGSDEVMARCGRADEDLAFAPVATESTFGEPNRCPGLFDQYSVVLDMRGVSMGDVDCTGQVDNDDALAVLQALARERTMSGSCTELGVGILARAGDRNNDSLTDMRDALLIAQCVLADDC